ncbi:MAG: hypothetical protein HWN68_11955, partial [Desulfobacterales bacterium]|nr:hypothetical protein [Desulfobacterales bacterium]
MKKIKNAGNIWIVLLIAAIAAGGTFVAVDRLVAESPTSIKVRLYQTDFFVDASASAQTVFADAAGKVVDIVGNPGVFGSGTVSQGTYNRMKFTVKNQILYSGPQPSGCVGDPLVDVTMKIDDTKADDYKVDLYFATGSDGGGSGWTANGTAAYPFLMLNAIKVGINQTTRVELRFNTAGNLNCIDASAKLSAPTINVLHYVEGAEAPCSIVGEYWFVHYNMSCGIYDDQGDMLEPTLGKIFESTNVVSGWGTATFDADGNWSVYMGNSYTDATYPGMAEHRHNLVSYDPANPGEDGYHDPAMSIPSGTAVGGQYVTAGSKIIMYMPEGGGFIEGGLSSDCNTF